MNQNSKTLHFLFLFSVCLFPLWGDISKEGYRALQSEATTKRDLFWEKEAALIDWIKPYSQIWKQSRSTENSFVGDWFAEGKLNVGDLCSSRWAKTFPDARALIWVSEEDTIDHPKSLIFTYKELDEKVNQTANFLKSLGIKKNDRICIWLSMVPELIISQLASAKLGAISCVVFGGYSVNSLKDRINMAEAKLLITMDESLRRGQKVPMKEKVDSIRSECPSLEKIVVVKRTNAPVHMGENDLFFNESESFSSAFTSEAMGSEEPLFILYTSGTTGKPKGIVHSTGGYIVYALSTLKHTWDLKGFITGTRNEKEEDLWFCTADIGWITGHTYITYGPLAYGVPVLMYEGAYNYPDEARIYDLIDRHKVTHLYTAPTLIRTLAAKGDEIIDRFSLSSLKVLGSVGEPLNPEAWQWYFEKVGKKHCAIKDTYWQTETGGYLIAPLFQEDSPHPGSCGVPFYGIVPVLLDEDGNPILEQGKKGYLCIQHPWPGMMKEIYMDEGAFEKKYLSRFSGTYFTGDGAYVDEEGRFIIIGRLDDVMKVSGHRFGTAEVEGAIASCEGVAEAAVISFPHSIKGEAIAAFVKLKEGYVPSKGLTEKIKRHVAEIFSAIAKPDEIIYIKDLPKTRSGKIVRRLLKALYLHEPFGDLSTLQDMTVVDEIKASLERKRD